MTAWCNEHWQRVREEKLNGILATMLLAREMVNDATIMRLAGWNEKMGTKADPARLNGIMQSATNVCCVIGERLETGVMIPTRKAARYAQMGLPPGSLSRQQQDQLVREQTNEAHHILTEED